MHTIAGAVKEQCWPIESGQGTATGLDWAVAGTAGVALVLVAAGVLMAMPDDAAEAARRAGYPASELAAAPAETIIAGYGGITHTHSSDVHFEKPGVTDLTLKKVDWIGKPFKSPIYYGIRVVRWPAASRVGAMVDFTHAKAISVRSQDVAATGTRNGRPAPRSMKIDTTFRHLEFSHGHNMLTLNGLLRLGRVTQLLQPYVGGGFGVSLPHTEVQFLDENKRTYEYQATGAVGQVLAGLEVQLPSVSIFFEYKFSLAPYTVPLSGRDGRKGNQLEDWANQLGSWWRGEAPEFGWLKTNLATHHLIGGVGVRIIRRPQIGTAP